MSAAICPSVSPASCFVQSPAWVRARRLGIPSNYDCVTALIPVWGYGTFDNTSTFNTLVFKEVWPFVYERLIENWVQTDGTNITKITLISKFVDLFSTSTTSGSGTISYGGTNSQSASGTIFTVDYFCANHIDTGVYTASVDEQFNPVPMSGDNWISRTAEAQAMLDAYPLTTSLNTATLIYPISTGIAQIGGTNQDSIGAGLMACCNGIGIRSIVDIWIIALPFPEIFDDYNSINPPSTWSVNTGAIICTKSKWTLKGAAPDISPGLYPYPNLADHNSIYGMTQPIGAPSVSSVINPASFVVANQITGNGVPWPNPVTTTTTITFNPSDVFTNLGQQFGILGFRSAPY